MSTPESGTARTSALCPTGLRRLYPPVDGRDFPPGDFVGTGGEIYGRHKGIIHYTVGQRKGLGLSFPQPMFVKELDVGKNQVVLAKAEELFSQTAVAQDINLISVESIPRPLRVKAKVRTGSRNSPPPFCRPARTS